MKINQKEIAKKAGVSQTTVSFVLNNNRDIKISEKTKLKILKIAEELGYRKFFPPVEKGFKTGNIGYILPSFIKIQDPYYHRFYEGIMTGLENKNLNLVLYKIKNSEEILYRPEIIRNVDGLIIEENIPDEIIEKLKEKIPVVLLNTKTEKVSVDYVMPDNKGGIIKAIGYLYERGYRKIGIFGMKPIGIHQKERLEGYYEGLKIFALKLKEEYISLPERKLGGIEEVNEYAEETIKKWFSLKEIPDSCVTFGDVYAISLIGVCNKLNIKIPEEFGIIGFDNIINCHYTNPKLTSIEQPLEEMGKKAVELLIERIKNPDKKIEKVIFDVELIIRESVR
jgi:LacI family transcriptional regulator